MPRIDRRSRFRPLLASAVLLLLLAGCREPQPEATRDEPPSALLERITRPGEGGAVHLVRLVQRGDDYAFDPPEIRASPGDVVRFVLSGAQPESVVFSASAAPAEAAAFIRSSGLDRGVLLTRPGDAYDVSFRDAPAGTYPFQSIPHADLGMRGTVVIESP